MQTLVQEGELSRKLAELTKPVDELEEGLLASAVYDGDLRLAVLKFYDPKAGRFYLWRDNTGHKPYCFSKLPMSELQGIRSRRDVIDITEEEKLDLLADRKIMVRKIITTDPLAIGGGNDSIRDKIEAWEADIKYYENYTYDKGLKMGTYYRITDGKVIPVKLDVSERVARSLDEILKRNTEEFVPFIREWAELLGQPLCDFRRIAMDIEVDNEEGRLPDPEDPTRRVISVSFFSERERLVYALRKGDEKPEPAEFTLELFDKESDLLRAVFSKMMDYPVVLTFNGDNFDLRYLKHRAEKLNIPEEENPIELQRIESSIKYGVHIDLYNFFKNRSIQVYAFSNKYSDYTLNTISESLIGKSKIEFEGNIADLPINELARYNLKDSELTYELTTMWDSVAIKLLIVISRIAKMPINDVGRLGVSNWIRSMLFFEHRKMGALIPRAEELAEKGGASSQAIIKGKKYKGGFVIEPKPGVFFDVSVLDFASLYPSLIKVYNLSYETVDCGHEECRGNVIPDTASWVCIKRKGIISLVTGSLRDLRVGHYKPLTRDTSLSKSDRELYGVVTQGLKVFLNASYGVLGFVTFAFYCLPVAEATAALGRYAITKTITKCQELGIPVIYGDTDSIFLKSPSKEQITTVSQWADKDLGVELDLDKAYRYVAFSSRKKNYFGVLPDGKVDIKGLTGRKSVHGDTPIPARVDGETRLTTVEAAYREYKKGRVVELLTISDALTTLWLPVSNAFVHNVDEIFCVETSKGRKLTLSGDHSVYVIDTFGRLSCKATRDIVQGDVLVGARLIPRESCSTDLNVFEHLRDLGVVKRGMVRCASPHSTTGTSIPARLPLSSDLGFLLGIYTAEGNSPAKPGSRTASISQDSILNPEVCREIESAWRRTFCWEIRNHTQTKSRSRYYLPVLYAQLLKRLCGGESGDKHVPSIVFDAPIDVVASYLRGLFSGDGWGNGRKVNLLSKSQQLISGTAYLLAYFDIDCRIRTLTNPRYGHYFQLSVLGAESRRTFYSRIGFLQKRFNFDVRTNPRNKELIPITTDGLLRVKADIEDRLGISRFRQINFHDSRKYNLSLLSRYNTTIGELLEHARPQERVLLASIGTMLNRRDVSYDEVTSVVRLPGSCTMYDFSMPVYERFVAGNLPTLLHNSQTPEFLKKTFYQTLDILASVQSQDDFARARERIRELLTLTMGRLKNKQIPVSDLAFNVMMGKPTAKYDGTTPQHVRAAQQLEKNGREIKAGDIISYVKTKNPPFVKPSDLAKVEEIDVDKYLEYAHSMFDQVLDALDFSFDEIMGATTLDFFWSS